MSSVLARCIVRRACTIWRWGCGFHLGDPGVSLGLPVAGCTIGMLALLAFDEAVEIGNEGAIDCPAAGARPGGKL